jgi:hypothetical protein
MSEDKKRSPKKSSEIAFEKWLDRSDLVDDEQSQQVKSNANTHEDAIWQERLKTARTVEHQVSLQAEQPVPHWDRSAAFESDKSPWWQWGGLPAMSMAFSIFAIALVLFKVELVMKDDGVLLTFAGSGQTSINQVSYSQEEINVLVDTKVDQKLQLFASEQQVILANYVADIKVKQQDNNLQLASYLIGATRKERKEDISDFVQYVNDQRADDSLDNKIKFQELKHEINYQSLKTQKINYQPQNIKSQDSGSLGLTTKPASWTSEE